MKAEWLTVLMFPALTAFFACVLMAALERSRRLAAYAFVLFAVMAAALVIWGDREILLLPPAD